MSHWSWAATHPRAVHRTAIAAASLSLVVPATAVVALPILIFAGILQSLRVRGAVGGASDSMTLHVAVAVWIATVIGGELAAEVCIYFVAVQSALSYFLAGLSKLQQPAWRCGVALSRYASALAKPNYARLIRVPGVAFVGAWAVMLMECTFAAALVTPAAAVMLLPIAAVFHLANAVLFGLHRFVLPWVATYPAIFYIASH